MSNETTQTVNDRSADTETDAAPSELRFEQAIGELEQIVTRLGQPNIDLDEAVRLYARGVELTQHGRTLISDAEGHVSQLRQSLNQPNSGGSDAPRS